MEKKLYRSTQDKMISGICGGIGEYFNIDPTLIRLCAVILGLATAIFPLVIGYIICMLVIPLDPNDIY